MGRFLTKTDMAAAKREEEISNSMLNRNEIKDSDKIMKQFHVICGCGVEGCMFMVYVRAKQITHVAIKNTQTNEIFSLPKPNRHHNIIHNDPEHSIEGFLTEENRFIDRREAYLMAKHSGQLNRLKGDQYYQGNELFSEDLW